MNAAPIQVFLVDDHPLIREGIKAALNLSGDCVVIGEAYDGQDAVQKLEQLNPQVVLLEIVMPKMNGLETMKLIRKKFPRLKVLILSMHNRHEYLIHFLEAGAKGYILKDVPPSELKQALQKVNSGQIYIGEGISSEAVPLQKANRAADLLSEREAEVLNLLAISSRSKDIAEKLKISVRTVEKHRSSIMKKLNIDNAAGIIRYALNQKDFAPSEENQKIFSRHLPQKNLD